MSKPSEIQDSVTTNIFIPVCLRKTPHYINTDIHHPTSKRGEGIQTPILQKRRGKHQPPSFKGGARKPSLILQRRKWFSCYGQQVQ